MFPVDATTVEKHEAVGKAGGYMLDGGRGLIEVTGRDRQDWLHNMVTNAVRTLNPGDGNYAFATTAQGRTVFDLHVLVFDSALWLDVDERWIAPALAHLGKYLVTEDVELRDISAEWRRIGILGRKAPRLVESLGLGGNFASYADVQHAAVQIAGHDARLVRKNIGPILAGEVHVPTAAVEEVAGAVRESAAAVGMVEIGRDLRDMIRIEAGQPASIADIDDDVIPPETLQVERGISHVKGCYIGQEVIERMRSRGVMARRLAGYRVAGDDVPPHDTPVVVSGKQVGRITSACRSVGLGGILGLGYVKTMLAQSGTGLAAALDEERQVPVEQVDVPLPCWRTP